jgi:hypothetical protein
MNDEPVLSRRAALKFAVAAAMTMVVHAHLPALAVLQQAQQALLPSRLAGLLAHSESAKVIGSEYLRMYPQEADLNVLLDLLAAQLAVSDAGRFGIADEQLRERLDRMIRADFADDRIVKLRGWVLSATEARVCALAVLL